jgi:outer membrane immunogenic protein
MHPNLRHRIGERNVRRLAFGAASARAVTRSMVGVLFGPASCHTRLTSFGTVTGRLGFAATDRALVFVKTGGAWGNFDRSVIAGSTGPGPGSVVGATASVSDTRWGVTVGTGTGPGPGSVVGATASVSDTRWGVTVGTGVEYALFRNWSAKVEYDFMDFGTHNEKFHFTGPALPGGSLDLYSDDREQVHVVRFGLNYRFGILRP